MSHIVVMFGMYLCSPAAGACDMVFNEGGRMRRPPGMSAGSSTTTIPPGQVRYPSTFRWNPRRAEWAAQ